MTISLHPSTLPAVLSPVLTPFTADGNPDAAKLLKQCKWLEANGVGQAMRAISTVVHNASSKFMVYRMGMVLPICIMVAIFV